MKIAHNTTIDQNEVEKFSRQAAEWWDESGPFKPLHRMNPVRIQYILNQLSVASSQLSEKKLTTDNCQLTTLKGVSLLDIGCGGGLMCEPLARLGAHVTGIDASEENIETAKLHAAQAGLAIDYICTSAEALAEDSGFRIQDSEKNTSSPESRIPNPESYDVVLALEIIEHVSDIAAFIAAASALTKPGGLLIFSTINRTAKSFALAILGAEYVLRLVPRGTHEWEKFVKPHELATGLRANDAQIADITGMAYNPFNGEWRLTKDIDVNYFLAARK